MRNSFIVGLFIIALLAALPCAAQKAVETKESIAEYGPAKEGEKGVVSEKEMTPLDIGEATDESCGSDYGVDKPALMPPGEMYDENTGLPNSVESDTCGEIE